VQPSLHLMVLELVVPPHTTYRHTLRCIGLHSPNNMGPCGSSQQHHTSPHPNSKLQLAPEVQLWPAQELQLSPAPELQLWLAQELQSCPAQELQLWPAQELQLWLAQELLMWPAQELQL